MKKATLQAIEIIIFSASASFAVVSLSDPHEFAYMLAALLAAAMSSCLLAAYCIYLSYSSRRRQKEMAGDIMHAVSAIPYYRSLGMTLPKSISAAAEAVQNEGARGILLSSSSRLRMGQGLAESIVLSASGEPGVAALISEYFPAHGDDDIAVKEAIAAYASEEGVLNSRMPASQARSATIRMFASTIAPSFVIFSFIGSMLLSQSATGIGIMAAVLIAALPFAYALTVRTHFG